MQNDYLQSDYLIHPMLSKPLRILFFLACLILVVLGISKLGHEEKDLGAVGIEELDTIPPPLPPVDVILD